MWRRIEGHSWHQINGKKFFENKDKIDFYVFVTYIPEQGEHKFERFVNEFIIVPSNELEKRIKSKKPSKEMYSFSFHFEKDKITGKYNTIRDHRETIEKTPLTDYSIFLDNWNLITNKLEKE